MKSQPIRSSDLSEGYRQKWSAGLNPAACSQSVNSPAAGWKTGAPSTRPRVTAFPKGGRRFQPDSSFLEAGCPGGGGRSNPNPTHF